MSGATAVTSLGTVLNIDIAAVMTPVVGMRDLEFNPGEVETFEFDDLDDTHVNLCPSGRTTGGEVTGDMFVDFAAATWTALADLWDVPAANDFRIDYADTGSSQQEFVGILKTLPVKAERGQPLISSVSIAVAEKPTLVGVTA